MGAIVHRISLEVISKLNEVGGEKVVMMKDDSGYTVLKYTFDDK